MDGSLNIYVVLCVILLEWKLSLLRFCWSTVLQFIERCSAPVITIDLPKVDFSHVSSCNTLITANSAGFGAIQCWDKGSNIPIGVSKAFSRADVEGAVRSARAAQVQWSGTPFSVRRKLLFSLLDYVLRHQQTICATSAVECGKTLLDGSLGEILTTLEKLRWTASRGEDVLREEVRDVGLMTIHKRAAVTYVPYGVIGAIVSWNYPFHNIFGPMISALFAGNGFVGKCSEYSSYYVRYYESIVREGLKLLGQPPELVHFITGFVETGEALIDFVDKVTFIGSPGVGKLVMKRAADTLTPVILELGGKDPAVICEDADLNQVIPIVMRGTFQNCGQNCVGLERIVVQESICQRLLSELIPKVQRLSQGVSSASPVKDLGAMTMGRLSVQRIQKLVDDSVAAGAKVLVGGKATSDHFFPPTIIVDVTSSTPIAREEVFGPVLVVMKYSTDEEAIRLVNDCPYGLGASVFSANVSRAQRIASRLHTGMCNINDFGINYLCQSLPFGGVKISGFDRFAGVEGLRGNCVVHAQTTDRIPGVKTVVPAILQYPTDTSSFEFMRQLTLLLYGNLWQSARGALALTMTKQPKK